MLYNSLPESESGLSLKYKNSNNLLKTLEEIANLYSVLLNVLSLKESYEIFFAQERSYTVYSEKVAGTGHILSFHQYTAISRKVVAKSARDNHEGYCGWF